MATSYSFHQFADRMALIADEVVKGTTKTIRKVALTVATTVIYGTPIDTSWARLNWFVSIGAAELHGDPIEIPNSDQTQEAISRAQDVIARWKTLMGDIYISNGVPYILELEQGSSKRQAPNGMVKLAIQAGRRVLKESRILPPGVG